jgi:multidrug resistance efflux pump
MPLRTFLDTGLRAAVTLGIAALAGFVGWRLWVHYQEEPWTRDGRVRADVVEVTPDVAGLVTEVAVANDQTVSRGAVLFVIDRDRYALAMTQAEAAIGTQQALVAVQQAAVETQQAGIAARIESLAEARREARRNDGLGSLVAAEATEQSHAKVAEDEAMLSQTEAAVRQAEAVLQQAKAALAQAETARAAAALNLERTTVRASVDGILSDMTLRPGDYVSPGRPVMALIDKASLRVEGYFEEAKLPGLKIGQPVSITLMGERSALSGHVQSIAAAIEDRERLASPNLLPNVNPTFSWVRLAQRVPVRIALDRVPDGIRLIAGRTATVTVIEGGGRTP